MKEDVLYTKISTYSWYICQNKNKFNISTHEICLYLEYIKTKGRRTNPSPPQMTVIDVWVKNIFNDIISV